MSAKSPGFLEVLLRGEHREDDVRRALAGLVGCPPAEIGRVDSADKTPYALELLGRAEGFRTQVTFSGDFQGRAKLQDDLALARRLCRALADDALVLEDPASPGLEPFHGLLARPDGKIFRVPLRELASGDMAIDEDRKSWQDWSSRFKADA